MRCRAGGDLRRGLGRGTRCQQAISAEHLLALERSLIQDLDRLGIGGYTITDARGRGSRGLRTSGWEHTSNIRLEVLCDAATAEKIVHHLRAHYEKDYAMTLWIQEAAT